MRRWLSREWSLMVMFVALLGGVIVLFALRSDPSFPVVSTVVGILIGGVSTTLLQTISHDRERRARLEEVRDAALQAIRQERLAHIRQMLEQDVMGLFDTKRDLLEHFAIAISDPGARERFASLEHGNGPISLPSARSKDVVPMTVLTSLQNDVVLIRLYSNYMDSINLLLNELRKLSALLRSPSDLPPADELTGRLTKIESDIYRDLGFVLSRLDNIVIGTTYD